MPLRKISDSAVRRLSHYLRLLDAFAAEGVDTVSSDSLAEKGGVTSAQVRKDLSLFGSFGKRGLGYSVPALRPQIAEILGLDRRWRVCLVGAGKLASALYHYGGFRAQGFDIVAVLDNDPAKIGKRWGKLVVEDVAQSKQLLADREVEMGIVVTPAENAQEVADALVRAGVAAILNFAPRKISVPPEVAFRDVNLVIELEGLSFALTHEGEFVTTR